MIGASKFLIGLGIALLALGEVAQGCEDLLSLGVNYDFKSTACKRSVIQGNVDCEDCAADLPTIIATFAAGSTACQTYATTLAFTCASDAFNEINCGEVLVEPRYLNCTEGFFSCCIGVYADYIEAVGGGSVDYSSSYTYENICGNSGVTIPDYGACTTISTSGVTAIDLPDLPEDFELDTECPEQEDIITKYASSCIPGPESTEEPDFDIICSQACAAELATVYTALVAASPGCGFFANIILSYCQYDTVSQQYCIEVAGEFNDTCGPYASSCCAASNAAVFEEFADTLAEPYKTYLKLASIGLDPTFACPEGTTIGSASTCQAAAAEALIGSAAGLSIWFAAALVAIFSIYIAM